MVPYAKTNWRKCIPSYFLISRHNFLLWSLTTNLKAEVRNRRRRVFLACGYAASRLARLARLVTEKCEAGTGGRRAEQTPARAPVSSSQPAGNFDRRRVAPAPHRAGQYDPSSERSPTYQDLRSLSRLFVSYNLWFSSDVWLREGAYCVPFDRWVLCEGLRCV